MQRRAILGGTFNPPHMGHLEIASTALEQAALQQVIWVPAGCPPHRALDSLPEHHHRLEMIRRAIAPYPAFSLSTIECDRPSASYAIYTLGELQRQYPTSQWYWIIGLDAFRTLPRWYRRLELIPSCTWLVAPRAIEAVIDPAFTSLCQQVTQQLISQQIEIQWQLLEMPLVAVSSSLIRQRYGDRHPIHPLVPTAVQDYIQQHQLYTSSPNLSPDQG